MKRLPQVDYILDGWGYPFLDSLRDEPTQAPPKKTTRSPEDGTSMAASSSTGSVTAGLKIQTGSATTTAKTEPWYTAKYPTETTMTETHGEAEPIHKIATRKARISIESNYLAINAVWLVPGRPGYLVYKEDDDGKPMDWMDPYCL